MSDSEVSGSFEKKPGDVGFESNTYHEARLHRINTDIKKRRYFFDWAYFTGSMSGSSADPDFVPVDFVGSYPGSSWTRREYRAYTEANDPYFGNGMTKPRSFTTSINQYYLTQMEINLIRDRLSKQRLLRGFIKLYAENDPDVYKVVEKIHDAISLGPKMGKKKKKLINKSFEAAEQSKKDYVLDETLFSDDELLDIFDLIDEE